MDLFGRVARPGMTQAQEAMPRVPGLSAFPRQHTQKNRVTSQVKRLKKIKGVICAEMPDGKWRKVKIPKEHSSHKGKKTRRSHRRQLDAGLTCKDDIRLAEVQQAPPSGDRKVHRTLRIAVPDPSHPRYPGSVDDGQAGSRTRRKPFGMHQPGLTQSQETTLIPETPYTFPSVPGDSRVHRRLPVEVPDPGHSEYSGSQDDGQVGCRMWMPFGKDWSRQDEGQEATPFQWVPNQIYHEPHQPPYSYVEKLRSGCTYKDQRPQTEPTGSDFLPWDSTGPQNISHKPPVRIQVVRNKGHGQDTGWSCRDITGAEENQQGPQLPPTINAQDWRSLWTVPDHSHLQYPGSLDQGQAGDGELQVIWRNLLGMGWPRLHRTPEMTSFPRQPDSLSSERDLQPYPGPEMVRSRGASQDERLQRDAGGLHAQTRDSTGLDEYQAESRTGKPCEMHQPGLTQSQETTLIPVTPYTPLGVPDLPAFPRLDTLGGTSHNQGFQMEAGVLDNRCVDPTGPQSTRRAEPPAQNVTKKRQPSQQDDGQASLDGARTAGGQQAPALLTSGDSLHSSLPAVVPDPSYSNHPGSLDDGQVGSGMWRPLPMVLPGLNWPREMMYYPNFPGLMNNVPSGLDLPPYPSSQSTSSDEAPQRGAEFLDIWTGDLTRPQFTSPQQKVKQKRKTSKGQHIPYAVGAMEPQQPGQLPAPADTLQSRHLQTVSINPDCSDECAICLDLLFTDRETCCRKLQCGHTFHKWCIEKWLLGYCGRICPLCCAEVETSAQPFEAVSPPPPQKTAGHR